MVQPSLHPLLDDGLPQGLAGFSGGTLHCRCPTDRVVVTIEGDVAHNHACGCSKCWKPDGALFSVVGVVPVANLKVTAHEEKLHVVDEAATIRRHACRQCGVHMVGHIVKDHPFRGLGFVHVELSEDPGWQPPQFAGFVSSIIEQGYRPEGMEAVRDRLKALGLPSYDCLSPALMDAIAGFTAKNAPAKHVPKPVRTAAAAAAPGRPPRPAAAAESAAARGVDGKRPGGIVGFISRLLGG